MSQTVEIGFLDLRLERHRLKNPSQERLLLRSILEEGLREPVQCVQSETLVVLDGFKRLRCAVKLGLTMVPYTSLAPSETEGILKLIQSSNSHTLHLLEVASFLDKLKRDHGMSVSEMARLLERSPAWASVRLGMLAEMGDFLYEEVFSGRFPARSYLYSLRPFTRVKRREEAEEFVRSVSGKNLSTRQMDWLAQAYFKGGPSTREQIVKGEIGWILEKMKPDVSEEKVLKELAIVQKYMGKVQQGLKEAPSERVFLVQAHVLIEGILSRMDAFIQALREFAHDLGG